VEKPRRIDQEAQTDLNEEKSIPPNNNSDDIQKLEKER